MTTEFKLRRFCRDNGAGTMEQRRVPGRLVVPSRHGGLCHGDRFAHWLLNGEIHAGFLHRQVAGEVMHKCLLGQ